MRKESLLVLRTLLAFVCGAMLLSSCSNSDYTNAIPASSTLLMKINTSKVDAKGAADVLKTLLPVDDMKDCGVDFTSDVYAFETVDGNFGVCARVEDADDLESLFGKLKEEHKAGDLRKQGDAWFTDINGTWAVAFSKTSLLIVGPVTSSSLMDVQRSMGRMLRQTEETSIVGRPIYERIDTMSGNVCLVAQVQALPEKMVAPFTLGAPKDVDASQLYVSANIDKKDGIVTLDGETFSFNASIDKQLKDADKVYRKINGRYVPHIPNTAMFFLYTDMDGKQFLPMLQGNAALQSLLVGLNTAIDFDNIIRSVDGDFVLMSNAFASDRMDMTVYAQVKSPTWTSDVDYWKQSCPAGSKIVGDVGSGWTYTSGGMKLSFGLNGEGDFYATTDESLALRGKGVGNDGVISDKLQRCISGNRFALVLNLKSLEKTDALPGGVSGLVTKLMGDTEAIVYLIK